MTRKLFTPFQIQSINFKNRIWVSPMCQYSSEEGHPTDWHLVHLGSRAIGGAGLIIVEATAVSPEGRISPEDSGIWSDGHIASFARITDFIKKHGSVAGIQIAHAGRKASTFSPWQGKGAVSPAQGGWQTFAPSAIAFDPSYTTPKAMSVDDISKAVKDFEAATKRCVQAGFEVLEIHMAHGYLMHEFLSPLSNQRKDNYGGNLENRMRFPLEVAEAVRKVWPKNLPLFARISATDWAEGGGWDLPESVVLCKELKKLGVDLIDCSTGGTLAVPNIPVGPGYQVRFADVIRKEVGIATGAVGLITDPDQAEEILESNQADAILMARAFLRNPYWPLDAARKWGISIEKAKQYGRS